MTGNCNLELEQYNVVEWTAQVPTHLLYRNSPPFTLQNCECHFTLRFGFLGKGYFKLFITSDETLSLPIDVSTYIVNERGAISYSRKTVMDLNECIFESVPDFDLYPILCFKVIFHKQNASSTSTASVGTFLNFNPPEGNDCVIKKGSTFPIRVRYECISCMKEYENKSLEELRFEDYAANRKVKYGLKTTFEDTTQQTGRLSSSTAAAPTSGFSTDKMTQYETQFGIRETPKYQLYQSLLYRHKSTQTSSHLDRLPCLVSLSSDFKKLLENNASNPDVRLQCGDCIIPAHRIILSSRSDVFKAMLQSDMTESRTGCVQIVDMEPTILSVFLGYLYSGTLPDLTVELALLLYEVGDKYTVAALKNRCVYFLKDNLTHENACMLLGVADAHNDKYFKEHIILYLVDNDLPLKCDQWPRFSADHPKLANEVLFRAYQVCKMNLNNKLKNLHI